MFDKVIVLIQDVVRAVIGDWRGEGRKTACPPADTNPVPR